jgi:hypothetical protein
MYSKARFTGLLLFKGTPGNKTQHARYQLFNK